MTKAEIARELVAKAPDAPARTLAKRLVNDYPEVFTLEQARSSIRYVIGQMGTKNRRKATAKRPARKPGQQPKFPESKAEGWKPFEIGKKGMGLVVSDLHVPFHNKKAVETAVRYARRRHRIGWLLINGDYGDWYTLSRFQRNPKKRDLRGEIELQKQGLQWLRAQFPRIPIIYKEGNHEVRLKHWVWQHSIEFWDVVEMQLPQLLELDKLKIEYVPDRPIMAGLLPCLHGHELRGGPFSPVNPARGAFMRCYDSVMIGHHHQTSVHSASNLWHDEVTTWSLGCLCDLTPEYARVNNWNYGFALVDIHKNSEYDVMNLRIGKDYAVRTS